MVGLWAMGANISALVKEEANGDTTDAVQSLGHREDVLGVAPDAIFFFLKRPPTLINDQYTG
jgi:hypothetical protein